VLPISLKLRNFLSYRDNGATLYLENVHVACLCGPNGHGKSALLDAITWVLWGKARGQRHDQLLHQTAQDMSVELEFEARDQRYRAIRRFARTRSQGNSSLELEVDIGGDYRVITENTISKTQFIINDLIGMEYDTFINSSFLLQGRADLFTMATSSQRKEVLSRVLALGLYDRLESRAKAKTREFQIKLEATELSLNRLEQQGYSSGDLLHDLNEIQARLVETESSVALLTERVTLLRSRINEILNVQKELKDLGTDREQIVTREKEAEREIKEYRHHRDQGLEITRRKDRILAGYDSLMDIRAKLLELEGSNKLNNELELMMRPIQLRIAETKMVLESEIRIQEKLVTVDLLPMVTALPSRQKTLIEIEAQLVSFSEKDTEANALNDQLQTNLLETHRLTEDNVRIAINGRDIRAKLDLLDHKHLDEAVCPLCNESLNPSKLVEIKTRYQREIEIYKDQYENQGEQISTLKRRKDELNEATEKLRKKMELDRTQLVARQVRSTADYEQSVQAKQKFDEVSASLNEVRRILREEQFALEDRGQLAECNQRREEVGFNQDEFTETQRAFHELEIWEGEYLRLQESEIRLNEIESSLTRAVSRRDKAVEEKQRLAQRIIGLERESSDLPAYEDRLERLDGEYREMAERRNQLQGQKSVTEHRFAETERALIELKQLESVRQGLIQQINSYSDLALAFGKGGIQALLIEAAIPRLEDEANRFLRLMTDGKMWLQFQTQRERRSSTRREESGSIETLDLLIGDELGTRNYEMFSGGESFRVDFALRIALSKLLAWRAGAPLLSLFIDEGFGTQDEQGRDRILDVIRSIEPDFQRILVVTHLEQIKDAFPVRIEVTRTEEGSTFAVV
jgi:exonuclease SbcC